MSQSTSLYTQIHTYYWFVRTTFENIGVKIVFGSDPSRESNVQLINCDHGRNVSKMAKRFSLPKRSSVRQKNFMTVPRSNKLCILCTVLSMVSIACLSIGKERHSARRSSVVWTPLSSETHAHSKIHISVTHCASYKLVPSSSSNSHKHLSDNPTGLRRRRWQLTLTVIFISVGCLPARKRKNDRWTQNLIRGICGKRKCWIRKNIEEMQLKEFTIVSDRL